MFKKHSQGKNIVYDICHWVCETEDDIKEIPYCEMGSQAYVIETGQNWIVNSKGTWYQKQSAGGSGGGSNPSIPTNWPTWEDFGLESMM